VVVGTWCSMVGACVRASHGRVGRNAWWSGRRHQPAASRWLTESLRTTDGDKPRPRVSLRSLPQSTAPSPLLRHVRVGASLSLLVRTSGAHAVGIAPERAAAFIWQASAAARMPRHDRDRALAVPGVADRSAMRSRRGRDPCRRRAVADDGGRRRRRRASASEARRYPAGVNSGATTICAREVVLSRISFTGW
jgi:hypothetical protein